MPRRKLKQTKKAIAARRRYAKNKRAGKLKKRGCGKRNWSTGGNARWKCKPGKKRHYYRRRGR